MIRNRNFWIFIAVSVLVVAAYFIVAPAYRTADTEIARIASVESRPADTVYYRKYAERLLKEYETLTNRASNRPTVTDFISRLPGLASQFGIRNISVENMDSQDERRDGSELRISLLSDFYQSMTFLSYLENSRLPLQIKTAYLTLENERIRSVITVRYFTVTEARETHGK